MKSILFGTLAAVVSTFALNAAAAQSDQQPSRQERMQHWMADRETMFHARLAGMKAALGLTPDQERLWSPFESAFKDAFKSHMEAMQKMMQMREGGERMSPVDRMEFMAGRMSQAGAELRAISVAAKPLYDRLDDGQKRKFGLLARGMAMAGRSPSGMSVEEYYGGGDVGFSWEPYGWWGMMME